ncbi:MAG: GNAT family N-acetyltransferase [Candidatus Hodarchaeota archaeon]
MATVLTRIVPESKRQSVLYRKSQFRIRTAKSEDIGALSDLWFYQRCYHEQWDKLYETVASGQQEWQENLKSSLKQPNHIVLVAEAKLGKILGYIHGSFYAWPFSPYEVYGSVNTIAISPEMQGKGLGKKLIQNLLDWFRKQEVQHISVHVDYRNEIALHLYKSAGFRSYQHRLMLSLETHT